MKNKSILIGFVCLLTFSLNLHASNFCSDEFQITPLNASSLDVNAKKAWTLKYNNDSDANFTIALMETKKGVEYVVYSRYFEVSYACCKNGFGAKPVKPAWSRLEDKYRGLVIDSEKMNLQQKISEKPVSESEALALIASYLPDLVKKEYKYLVD